MSETDSEATSQPLPISTTETWNPVSPPDPDVIAYADAHGIGMKWYYVLIWLDLTVGLLLGAWNAIQYLTGLIHLGAAEYVYKPFPMLQVYDVAYGLFALALVAGRLYVRKRMTAFKQDGPKLYLILIAAGMVGLFVHTVLVSTISSAFVMDFETAITARVTVVANIVEIIVNKIYFDRRAELFRY